MKPQTMTRYYTLSIATILLVLACIESRFVRTPYSPSITVDDASNNSSSTAPILSPDAANDESSAPPDGAECGPSCEILEPKGTHHPWYSLEPFAEGVEWAATPGPYFRKMIAQNDNEPVFKMHPGFAAIALTDHASGKWFFEQPDTVLDREVNKSEGFYIAYCYALVCCDL